MPTTSKSRVRDLFQIPERIGKMDFTVALADGIARADETVKSYVTTPQLVTAFRSALGQIDQALSKRQSQATYLHGSFGSGKSHFMAMLSLLLANHEGAWNLPDFHALRVDFPWIGESKILELHVHMLNQPDLETPVFRAYLDHVREHHPEADLPALFADERLFDDAERLREKLGDEAFFAPMTALSKPATKDTKSARLAADWKKVRTPGKRKRRATAGAWDRERFDATRSALDPDKRAELLTALTRTHFTSFADATLTFVDIDRGLAILSRHAKSLGYDAIVLLLDELILWLSYMGRQPELLGRQVQRMVKLVEATDNDRPAPIVSFIARQRSLRAMVGEELADPDDAHLAEVLDHARGRFGEVILGDNNLPAIVEKRVLIPKDADTKAELTATFDRLRSESQHKGSWTTLLGSGHDADAFRKLYPFSPVLIDALVALSNALQRQRTAIKLLTELLMMHIEDLRLGQLVGNGDLFDVMAEGTRATDGPMAARFEAARKLYKHELLPLIQEANGTTTAERCQRMRPDHPPDIGCANCLERACRNDNRVIKTLLTAALVPGVKAFRDLTARRLVELNHGQLTSKIPGRESTALVGKLRKWAADIGQLRIGEQADPQVEIQLEGVDVRPLLAQAGAIDNDGRRRKTLYALLYASLGFEAKGELYGDLAMKHEWRGTRRPGTLRFDNVRRMNPELLRCPEDQDWRLIIDYPFDEEGHGPHEDERVIEAFQQAGSGSWTLVWLPNFFSEATNKTLGELVRVQHILETQANFDRFVGHLNVEQQDQAKLTLQNLESQKRQHLKRVLAKAYGLVHDVNDDDGDLDPSRRVERHLYLLKDGATLGTSLPGHLGETFPVYVSALLDARFPRHPRFDSGSPLTSGRLERLTERFQAIIEAPDKKINGERRELEELRRTLGELGLVRVTENTAHLRTDGILETIERRRLQKQVQHPSVDEVLRWADENEQMGLQHEAQTLLVQAYALWQSRTLLRGDKPYSPSKGKPLPGDVVLELPDLPSQQEWSAAIEMAGHAFGVSVRRKALNGENLRRFADALDVKIKAQGAAAVRQPLALQHWRDALSITERSARLATANAASKLHAALQGQSPAGQARVLAAFDAAAENTSPQAIGSSLVHGEANLGVLDNQLVLGVFRQLLAIQTSSSEAKAILDEVAGVLRQNELQTTMAKRIEQLAQAGQELLGRSQVTPVPPPTPGTEEDAGDGEEQRSPPPAPRPGVSVLVSDRRTARGREEVLEALEDLFGQLRDAAEDDENDDIELHVQIELHGRRS